MKREVGLKNMRLHPKEATHVYQTEQLWLEMPLFLTWGYHGKTCYRRRTADGDFGSGRILMFGRIFTIPSCEIYTRQKRLIGAELVLETPPSPRNLDGRATCHPQKLHADKGYYFPFCRQAYTVRHIKHCIAKWGAESSIHLGRNSWGVE